MMMRSWPELRRGRGVKLFEHYDSLDVLQVQHPSKNTLTISLPPEIYLKLASSDGTEALLLTLVQTSVLSDVDIP